MASVLDRFRLEGRTALVTGASRGLGASMAGALAQAGADVIVVARGDLSATCRLVEAAGRKAWPFAADQASRASLDRLLGAFGGALPWPDIVVNNGGTIRRAAFTEFSLTDWDEVIETNLTSVFRLSQRVARRWVEEKRRGTIIHVASMLSFQGGIRVASYTAAKSALAGLTRIMANELAPHGINVNAIAPGYMATDNTAQLRADAARSEQILARIPAGRWGEPDDLAGAVVFLASPAAAYVHGHILAVDGGWLAR
ncbi:MAG TPA: SDR family oxidoreductase [Opitutaceae bacterium]|nr:SDR family oxidoreductase [Opitutaceae bacterium]